MAGFSWRRGGLDGPSLWREEDRVGGAAARLVASPSKSESKAGVDGLPRMIQCWTPNASPDGRDAPRTPSRYGGKMYGRVGMKARRDPGPPRDRLHHAGGEVIMPACAVAGEKNGNEM